MEFPKDVEIGKYYSVPHVFCLQFYEGLTNIWMPVNTPLHDDIEYIGLKTRHYHIDWRFVASKLYKWIMEDPIDPRRKTKIEQAWIICEQDLKEKRNIEGEIVYKKVKCKRQYSNIHFHSEHQILYNTWPIKLQAGYCGTELSINKKGQYVCPHKGTIIDLKYVDEFGFAVCPAHLLRFDTSTLKAVKEFPKNNIS